MGLTFFHAISSDVIRKFHILFPHILRKFLTLFPTFSTLYGILSASFRIRVEYEKTFVSSLLSHNNDRLERYYE